MLKLDWFNVEMVNQKIEEFNSKFSNYSTKELIELIKTCDFDTFRLICNAMDRCSYLLNASFLSEFPFEDQRMIKKALNNRVNEVLGDYAYLYDGFLRTQKYELWAGDERYKLFGYDIPPYNDCCVIKSIVIYVYKYLGKPIDIKNVFEINNLCNHSPSKYLVKPLPYNIAENWMDNPKDFKIQNDHRRKECEAWYSFMEYVWNKEYDLAFAILRRYGTFE